MGTIEWKLDEYLERYNISPAQLEREIVRLGYDFGTKTIYRFTGKGPKNLNRGSLSAILEGLQSITGEAVSPNDLLELTVQQKPEPPAPPPEEQDEESRMWLEADIAPPLEPYDWGDVDPDTLGTPVRYVPGVGLVEEK